MRVELETKISDRSAIMCRWLSFVPFSFITNFIIIFLAYLWDARYNVKRLVKQNHSFSAGQRNGKGAKTENIMNVHVQIT